jgi:hypothetical protein
MVFGITSFMRSEREQLKEGTNRYKDDCKQYTRDLLSVMQQSREQ